MKGRVAEFSVGLVVGIFVGIGAVLLSWSLLSSNLGAFERLLSILSSLAIFGTFYWTFLQSAKLSLIPGEFAYFTFQPGGLKIVLPVTFVNRGARQGTMTRIAMSVLMPGGEDPYLLQAWRFMRQREGGQHVVESDVVPLPIPGRSSTVRLIAFAVTDNDHLGPYRKGTCDFGLWCWVDGDTEPRQFAFFQFGMSEETAELYNQLHSKGDATPD